MERSEINLLPSGEYRRRNRDLRVLFHDTHHRALTARKELARFDLDNYDGVLAYGASLEAGLRAPRLGQAGSCLA